MSAPITPRAMRIARLILEGQAGVWYVAGNETQREIAQKNAARLLEPELREIEAAAARNAATNPT